jgi:hypothetical protein
MSGRAFEHPLCYGFRPLSFAMAWNAENAWAQRRPLRPLPTDHDIVS